MRVYILGGHCFERRSFWAGLAIVSSLAGCAELVDEPLLADETQLLDRAFDSEVATTGQEIDESDERSPTLSEPLTAQEETVEAVPTANLTDMVMLDGSDDQGSTISDGDGSEPSEEQPTSEMPESGSAEDDDEDTNEMPTPVADTSPAVCLLAWRDDSAAAACTMPSQSDWGKCADLLDCWQEEDCSASDACTTDANNGECHVNRTGASSQQAQMLAGQVFSALCN